MILDCQVHICADTTRHGSVSDHLGKSLMFLFLRWRLGLTHDRGAPTQRQLQASLVGTIRATEFLDAAVADPLLLVPALQHAVTVIAAHCGTRAHPIDTDFSASFIRLARDYEHFYGDTSALNLPFRSYVYDLVLDDETVRRKLVHGSGWPSVAIP